MPSPRARAAKPSPSRRPRVAGRITSPSKDTVAQDEAKDVELTPESAADTSQSAQDTESAAATTASTVDTVDAVDTDGPKTEVIPQVTESAPQDAVPAAEAESTSDKPKRKPRPGKESAPKSKSARESAQRPAKKSAAATAVVAEQAGRGSTLAKSGLLPIVLGAVFVVFAAAATVFGVFAYRTAHDGSASNTALADPVETSSVIGQVTNAVQTVFSYNYTDTAKTEQAAQTLLSGKAIDQYNQLFGQVKKLAPEQKLVDTVTVQQAGVKMLSDDRAEVLLFLDQRAVRTDNGQSNGGPSQMIASAQQVNGVWKITNFTML